MRSFQEVVWPSLVRPFAFQLLMFWGYPRIALNSWALERHVPRSKATVLISEGASEGSSHGHLLGSLS